MYTLKNQKIYSADHTKSLFPPHRGWGLGTRLNNLPQRMHDVGIGIPILYLSYDQMTVPVGTYDSGYGDSSHSSSYGSTTSYNSKGIYNHWEFNYFVRKILGRRFGYVKDTLSNWLTSIALRAAHILGSCGLLISHVYIIIYYTHSAILSTDIVQEWPKSIVCEYTPAGEHKVILINFMSSIKMVFATSNNLVRNLKVMEFYFTLHTY